MYNSTEKGKDIYIYFWFDNNYFTFKRSWRQQYESKIRSGEWLAEEET